MIKWHVSTVRWNEMIKWGHFMWLITWLCTVCKKTVANKGHVNADATLIVGYIKSPSGILEKWLEFYWNVSCSGCFDLAFQALRLFELCYPIQITVLEIVIRFEIIIKKLLFSIIKWREARGLLVNVLDGEIDVNEFEHQSSNYVHFWPNTVWKWTNSFHLLVIGRIVSLLFVNKDRFGIE